MIVLIVNLTDAPGCTHQPTQVDIYNKTLDPGSTIRIPADLVDKNLRSLEERGIISIGQIPSWYTNAKATKGKSLSPEEKQRRIAARASKQELPKKVELSLIDNSAVSDELVALERKRKR